MFLSNSELAGAAGEEGLKLMREEAGGKCKVEEGDKFVWGGHHCGGQGRGLYGSQGRDLLQHHQACIIC